jgi:hypothetical protein
MSNIPISSLPIAVALTGTEEVPLNQAGTTKSATVALINSQNIANIPAGGLTGQGLVKQSNTNYDTIWKTVSGFGTVQEVDTGTGLTGGPITLTGTVSLAPITSHTLLANITGGSAAPIPNTPTSVLDIIGATQGDILYRNASNWTVLPPGNSGQILTSGGAAANPSWSGVGSGSVQSVALVLPGIFTVSGSPVTTTGTLTGSLNTQSANLVWAGPGTGAASAPTFRSLVGADLPNPSASTLGGIQSTIGASHQWISSISTSGVPALTQPAFTDISGTIAASQLPNPTATTLGGIESFAAQGSKWINQISTSGVPSATQPGFGDLSGNATLAQLPVIGSNAILSNITGGSATPLGNTLTSLIDTIGSTQGDVLYRNASSWVVLPPGTSGQVLSSGGAAANPAWTTVSGTGTVTSVATNNGLTGGAITSSGTIGLASIATGNVLAFTGSISGVPVATAPTAVLDVIGSTEGDVLYRGASTWAALAPGTAGQFLQTGGASSTPSWATALTTAGTGLTVSGATIGFSAARQTLPTTQVFTSGSAATYTKPANCLWIEVQLVGGGGGGGGGNNATPASNGGATSFSAFTASAGGGGAPPFGGGGGAASGGYSNVAGSDGSDGNYSTTSVAAGAGGSGGASCLGGAGQGGGGAIAGSAAKTNSGSGGGGGGTTTAGSNNSGGGGGAGGCVWAIITSPASTYTYTVGAGGSGASAGSNGSAGGNGAAGQIIVIEHYGS